MRLVYENARMSKDESTHIGAVVVGRDREVKSMGYNCFPRGLDDKNPDRQIRPQKYFYFEHAERNAIYNASLQGVSLDGCTMFTMGIPCADCGRGVIQSGIDRVIVHQQWPRNGLQFIDEKESDKNRDQWSDSIVATIEMFDESGVDILSFDMPLGLECLFNGEVIKV